MAEKRKVNDKNDGPASKKKKVEDDDDDDENEDDDDNDDTLHPAAGDRFFLHGVHDHLFHVSHDAKDPPGSHVHVATRVPYISRMDNKERVDLAVAATLIHVTAAEQKKYMELLETISKRPEPYATAAQKRLRALMVPRYERISHMFGYGRKDFEPGATSFTAPELHKSSTPGSLVSEISDIIHNREFLKVLSKPDNSDSKKAKYDDHHPDRHVILSVLNVTGEENYYEPGCTRTDQWKPLTFRLHPLGDRIVQVYTDSRLSEYANESVSLALVAAFLYPAK